MDAIATLREMVRVEAGYEEAFDALCEQLPERVAVRLDDSWAPNDPPSGSRIVWNRESGKPVEIVICRFASDDPGRPRSAEELIAVLGHEIGHCYRPGTPPDHDDGSPQWADDQLQRERVAWEWARHALAEAPPSIGTKLEHHSEFCRQRYHDVAGGRLAEDP